MENGCDVLSADGLSVSVPSIFPLSLATTAEGGLAGQSEKLVKGGGSEVAPIAEPPPETQEAIPASEPGNLVGGHGLCRM